MKKRKISQSLRNLRIIFLFLICLTDVYASTHQKYNFLVLLSYNDELPWEKEFRHGLEEGQNEFTPTINFFYESMDANRLQKQMPEKYWVEYLSRKYGSVQIDGIIIESDVASALFLKYFPELFPGIPVVCYADTKDVPDYNATLTLQVNVNRSISETIQLALEQNPNATHVYVVDRHPELGNRLMEILKQTTSLPITRWTDFSLPDLEKKVQSVGKNSIIFYTRVHDDNTGKKCVPKEVLESIVKVSPVPVYSFYSSLLGTGTIGGRMIDASKTAKELVRALLDYHQNGAFGNYYHTTQMIIDYSALNRYGISTSTIPQNAYVINKPIPIWKSYPLAFFSAVSIISLLTALSITLLLLYTRVKKVQMFEKLQKFVDLQHSIVILTDGYELQFANKRFFEFFGYDTIEAFHKDHACICDCFVRDDIFFHLGKVTNNEKHWIESMLHVSGRNRIVSMLDHYLKSHAFVVSINQFDSKTYVVNFTDISDNFIEKLELEKQALHDQLTGMYNRTYFDINIITLINQNNLDHKSTGFIIFDIDHFKTVNDQYGHDVGDSVLIELSALIQSLVRKDDYLIRWGGEEFLLIFPTDNLNNIEKFAEHLRTSVSNKSFKYVDKLTCSFGGTLHVENESVQQTIKRTDIALYNAKNNGRNQVIVNL